MIVLDIINVPVYANGYSVTYSLENNYNENT